MPGIIAELHDELAFRLAYFLLCVLDLGIISISGHEEWKTICNLQKKSEASGDSQGQGHARSIDVTWEPHQRLDS